MISAGNRDWTDARAKVDAEGKCRNCGRSDVPLEADHISGRKFDGYSDCRTCNGSGRKLASGGPCGRCGGSGKSKTKYVHPEDIVPLCGPVYDPKSCHAKKHARTIDLLPILELHEELRAVRHFGGIEEARVKLAPSAYPSKVVGA